MTGRQGGRQPVAGRCPPPATRSAGGDYSWPPRGRAPARPPERDPLDPPPSFRGGRGALRSARGREPPELSPLLRGRYPLLLSPPLLRGRYPLLLSPPLLRGRYSLLLSPPLLRGRYPLLLSPLLLRGRYPLLLSPPLLRG